jgi:hypothetical protein
MEGTPSLWGRPRTDATPEKDFARKLARTCSEVHEVRDGPVVLSPLGPPGVSRGAFARRYAARPGRKARSTRFSRSRESHSNERSRPAAAFRPKRKPDAAQDRAEQLGLGHLDLRPRSSTRRRPERVRAYASAPGSAGPSGSELSHSVFAPPSEGHVQTVSYRSVRSPVRTSSEKSSGCSQAAKCPPLSSRL